MSFAALYAQHRIATETAAAAQGMGPEPTGSASVTGAGDVEVCLSGDCSVYSEFVVDDSGLLVDFQVDGQAIGPRLGTTPDPVVKLADSTVEFVSAYQSVSSNVLLVNLKATAGSQGFTYSGTGAEYVNPEGVQVAAADGLGPTYLQPGAVGYYAIGFDDQAVGGTLVDDAFVTNGSPPVAFEFQIEAVAQNP